MLIGPGLPVCVVPWLLPDCAPSPSRRRGQQPIIGCIHRRGSNGRRYNPQVPASMRSRVICRGAPALLRDETSGSGVADWSGCSGD